VKLAISKHDILILKLTKFICARTSKIILVIKQSLQTLKKLRF